MDKICTSLEQSKKLIELGLDKNTADMYWDASLETPLLFCLNCNAEDRDYDKMQKYNLIIAWSLTALLELMPVIDDTRSPELVKTVNKDYRMVYHSTAIEKGILVVGYDNPLDAAYSMVVFLLKNKYL